MKLNTMALIFLAVLHVPFLARSQENRLEPKDPEPVSDSLFVDPMDGAFDVSRFLGSKIGFLATPIIITEPAVGYGGGLSLVYMHDKFDPTLDGGDPRKGPPSFSGVFGMYTENGTNAGGLFHFGTWKDDSIRYFGVGGYMDINLDLYGPGTGSNSRHIEYNISGWGVWQQLKHRVEKSNFFFGLDFRYYEATIDFNNENTSWLPEDWLRFDNDNTSIGLLIEYDSRNSIFSPSNGTLAKVEFSENWGNRYQSSRFDCHLTNWWQLHEKVSTGICLDGKFSDGEVPFYMLPYVDMRGIPAMRYLGKHVLQAQLELRWNFWKRWTAIGFAGVGEATTRFSRLDHEQSSVVSKGLGFRYMLARRYNIDAGIDVAWGPDEVAWYIQVGTSW